MHFALPPRKTSFPPPHARLSTNNQSDRRKKKQVQYLAYLLSAVVALYLVLNFFSSDYAPTQDDLIPEDSSVLIVTVLDEPSMSEEYTSIIKRNRDEYAARHGYRTFYTNTSTYTHLTRPSPVSWAVVPALRHALTQHPDVDYLWSLTPHALIMNPSASLYDHVLANLTNLVRKDVPVVPPDSVIHTFSHLKASQVYLIITQDHDNVAHTSFILRNTQTVRVPSGKPKDSWSQYFLDAWFDPLYRSYAFQKAEGHALEHIIQWHPTVLAKLAVVDQHLLNGYNYNGEASGDDEIPEAPSRDHESNWRPGDLVINFKGCSESEVRNCEKEIKFYFKHWEEQLHKLDGHSKADKQRAG